LNPLLLRFSPKSMDTISRENNSSMLPVGGIIVGVVALLLSGYAAITLSKVNKTLAAHEEKMGKIEGIETQVTTAAADAARANKAIGDYARQTQTGFDSVVGELSKFREEITKMQEAKKAPTPAPGAKGAAGNTPAVAGPDEYIVKAGDSSGTKIATARGISLADLQAVNPGVDWTKLKIGQKLKLPAKH
jgi:LysM repeat protein